MPQTHEGHCRLSSHPAKNIIYRPSTYFFCGNLRILQRFTRLQFAHQQKIPPSADTKRDFATAKPAGSVGHNKLH